MTEPLGGLDDDGRADGHVDRQVAQVTAATACLGDPVAAGVDGQAAGRSVDVGGVPEILPVDPDRAAIDRAEAHGARAGPDGEETGRADLVFEREHGGGGHDRVLPSARIAAAASSALIS